jgi:hypothetical protein
VPGPVAAVKKRLLFTRTGGLESRFLRRESAFAVSQTAAQILYIPTGIDCVAARSRDVRVLRGRATNRIGRQRRRFSTVEDPALRC